MQVQQSFERPQLPLFDVFLAGASADALLDTKPSPPPEDDRAFSEHFVSLGHAVTDDVIDRSVQRIGETVLALAGRPAFHPRPGGRCSKRLSTDDRACD